MIKEIRGYRFDDETERGPCPVHPGPVVDVPHMLNELILHEPARALSIAGLWGVGWCPEGRHFQLWELLPIEQRYHASDSDPYGVNYKISLDKFEEPI